LREKGGRLIDITRTSKDGDYAFQGLRGGQYTVIITHESQGTDQAIKTSTRTKIMRRIKQDMVLD
ncbi:MAG: hypothetical protein SVY53_08430, partial [Chloroflexota bacterium]|nr:hypothetical protein [Chloroflexota bacterium]